MDSAACGAPLTRPVPPAARSAEPGDRVEVGAAALARGAGEGGPEGVTIGAPPPCPQIAPDGRVEGREAGAIRGKAQARCWGGFP